MLRTALIYKAALFLGFCRENITAVTVFCLYEKKAWSGLFLDCFHQCFNVPSTFEGRYLASKRLPFKVLLILGNAFGQPALHEFNTKGVKVVYLLPNTTSLIQPLKSGGHEDP